MAEAVVSFIVERMGDLLIEEGNFLAGVSDQVRQMQTELQRIQNFLKDADNRQEESNSVRGWVSEIRELAYDAESIIETFVLEIASRRDKRFSKKFKRYATIFIEVVKIHKLGNQIEAIQGKIIDLTRSLQTYGILNKNEHESSTRRRHLRRSYSHVVENHTVGLDEDLMMLVPKLVVKEERYVISICGMGGLGKTTLAKKLYHHVDVRSYFAAFAWSCISQQFQVRDVLVDILVKLSSSHEKEDILKMGDDEIAKKLYKIQQEQKCLVVLDDIWREADWEALKHAFPIHDHGVGMIIFTTRSKSLARYADPNAFCHEPKTLTETESWDLLQTKFPRGFTFDMAMEKIGREIVKKCAGLPMAIVVVGGVLSTNYAYSEWEKVNKNVNWYLKKSEGTNQENSIVHGVLGLSYNELPYHLKPCFLHLGHFPEDSDIPCNTLLKMWVAEGFVVRDGDENETMEDVVERYLNDLVDRSIVQVSQMGSIEKVKTCRLHDLMREFCLSKANEENYLQIVRATNLNEKLNSNKVRRLVVHRDGANNFDLGHYVQAPNLRSFLLFVDLTRNDNYPRIKSSFTDFKLVKIMSLEKCTIGKKMGNEIGGLIHLRYLGFRNCVMHALPSSFGNLRYLQTFILVGCRTMIPNIFWKLEQLRHLILLQCVMEGGELLKLGNTRELRTLKTCSRLNMDIDHTVLFDVGELVESSHLEKLALVLNDDLNKLPSGSLSSLISLCIDNRKQEQNEEELKRLLLSCPRLMKLSYAGRLIKSKLPEWQHFPQNLIKLILMNCRLEEDPMPILEKLPNLRILRLKEFSFEGRLLVCSSKGFPKLQTFALNNLEYLEEWRVDKEAMPNLSHLYIRGCPNLEEWRVDEEAMPNLSQLHISYCLKLKMIPEGIKFISTLRQLEIIWMSRTFEDRLRGDVDGREGEDFYKVRHVPSIIIGYTLN